MNVHIEDVDMMKNDEDHYIGHTTFRLDENKDLFEVTFLSKRGTNWDYSINFAKEPGSEEELIRVDTLLMEDETLFDQLLDAALDTMYPAGSEVADDSEEVNSELIDEE